MRKSKTKNRVAAEPWLKTLTQLVGKNPIAILRFDSVQWGNLQWLRESVRQFTVARSHSAVRTLKVPTLCLILTDDAIGTRLEQHIYLGLVTSRTPITTFESRIKVRHVAEIKPSSEAGLLQLVSERLYSTLLRSRLASRRPLALLSPKLSVYMIERLASIDANHRALQGVAEAHSAPRRFTGTAALQDDALRTALKAFGLDPGAQASHLELFKDQETALARVSIMEDSVVEHDARSVPGYKLVQSDVTGRAVFRRGFERLEVYTANRRPLEHVFGVDLIYLNVTRQNIVMLQYKMLEPSKSGAIRDWIYRPDKKLEDEIKRMQRFVVEHPPGPHEYRLNPAVFYLKFVKRDASINKGTIITPIDHYEKFRKDPASRGPRGALKVSYTALGGRYLREGAFLDLIRSGYIGAHADTTAHLKVLVDAVLKSGRAVVAAIADTTGP